MEPEWMRQVSSKTVCDLYYVIFVIYAILGVLAVVNIIMIAFSKMPLMFKIAVGGQGLIMAAVLIVLSMFQYIVCDRALLSGRRAAEGFKKNGMAHSSGFKDKEDEDEMEGMEKMGFMGMGY
jgi:hypothetical protein